MLCWLKPCVAALFLAAASAFAGTPRGAAPDPSPENAAASALFHLAFSAQPSPTQTMVVVTPPVTVSIRDFFGDAVPQANVNITLTLRLGDGTLLGTTHKASDAYGLATFDDLAFSTPGTKQLLASAAGYDPAASDSFAVAASDPVKINVTTQPSTSAVAGTLFARQPVATLESGGHVRTGDNTTVVSVSASSGTGSLLGTTSVKVKQGVAQFTDLALTVAGNATLTFSAQSAQSASSSSIAVSAAGASSLTIVSQPSTAVVNVALAPVTVQLLDKYGNKVPQSGTTVRASMSSGSGGLQGTTQRTTNSTGLATFDDLSFNAMGDKTLTASSSGLQSVLSAKISVTAGAPAKLAFLVQPSTVRAGTEISPAPQIQLQDALGNPATADGVPVSLTLNGGGTLAGTTNRQTSGGTVTFPGISVTKAGQKTITASASGMNPVGSAPFSVTPGPAAAVEATSGSQQSTVVYTAFPAKLKATVKDGFGNAVGGLTVSFSVPGQGAGASFEGGHATATTDSSGAAVSALLTANGVAGTFVVTASVPGVSTPASFSLENRAAGVTVLTPVAGTPQSAAVANVFPSRLQVAAKDAGGNPVSNAIIRFRPPTSGPSATFSGNAVDSAQSDAQGLASSRLLTANNQAGKYDIVASADGGASATFAMTNTSGPLARMTIDAAPSGGKIDSQMVNQQFAIRLRAVDQFDNVVTSFTGQAVISSDGLLSLGAGITGSFQQGVLPSYPVAFAQAGAFVLVATRSGGTEGGTSNQFVVANPKPTFASIAPNLFHPGDTALVTIDGTGFLAGVTTASLGSGVTLTAITVVSPTRLTAHLAVSTDAAPGTRDLSIINPGPGGGSVVARGVVQIAGNAVPTVAAVTPSVCFQGQHLTLVVQGSGFAAGVTTAQLSGTGLRIDTTSVDSASRLRLAVTVQQDAPVGGRDLIVSNSPPGGGSVTRTAALVVNSILAAVPMPIFPPNGAENVPAIVPLRWQEVPGITRYHVQLSGDSSFLGAALLVDAFAGALTDTAGPLNGAVKYYWRVQAVLGSGTGPWSPVFTFAVTPTAAKTLAVAATIAYPSLASPGDYAVTDYRLVGMPGTGNVLLSALVPGTAGTDWQAYWDNGASGSNFVAYNGTAIFTAKDGRGFWLIKRGPWVVAATVAAMPVDTATLSVAVPLHTGWNIITDPFTWRLSWRKVRAANALTQPLYGYNGGFFLADTLEPCHAYYFFNDTTLSSLARLLVPVNAVFASPPTPLLRTAASDGGWTVGIAVRSEGSREDVLRFGVDAAAQSGRDPLDAHKPASPGGGIRVRFFRPEWDSNYPDFAWDFRPLFTDSAAWTVTVEPGTHPAASADLVFEGIDRIPQDLAVVLIDPLRRTSVDLRRTPYYRMEPVAAKDELRLLIGRPDLVQRNATAVHPLAFALGQNFPNPFNPSTLIPVELPERAMIVLKLFDIGGREVRTLHSGPLEAGRHFFTWKGNDNRERPVASGVYLCRMEYPHGKIFIRKLLLVR